VRPPVRGAGLRRLEAQQDLRAVAAAQGNPRRGGGRVGVLVREIIAAAGEVGADPIVMSTHGRCGLARLLAGGVTAEAVRRCRRPVLALPPSEEELAAAPSGAR
jgi:nucleotide-binding universal stress UspA family protein